MASMTVIYYDGKEQKRWNTFDPSVEPEAAQYPEGAVMLQRHDELNTLWWSINDGPYGWGPRDASQIDKTYRLLNLLE